MSCERGHTSPAKPAPANVANARPHQALQNGAADRRTDVCEAHIARRLAYLRDQSLGGPEDPGSLHRSFVNLQLRPDRSAQPGQPPQPFDSLDELLAKHPRTPVWLLVGEPGGGKSTLLYDLELRRAAACLAHWEATQAAPNDAAAPALPELCIRASLAHYTAGTSPAPADWVAAQWAGQFSQPGDAPPTLDALARRANLRFLLDGLNEIRASTPEAR